MQQGAIRCAPNPHFEEHHREETDVLDRSRSPCHGIRDGNVCRRAGGFLVSPVQLRVLGAAHVQQQVTAPASAVTVHQASVLTPRKLKTATATTGAAR